MSRSVFKVGKVFQKFLILEFLANSFSVQECSYWLWEISSSSRKYLIQNQKVIKYVLEPQQRRGKIELIEPSAVMYLQRFSKYYSEIDLMYSEPKFKNVVDAFFTKLNNVKLRALFFVEKQEDNDILEMLELIEKYKVSKLSFHPASTRIIQRLFNYQSLQNLELLLSKIDIISVQINLPPNLQSLALCYFDESLHQGLLVLTKNIQSLSLECAKIQNFSKFAKLIHNSNVQRLKVTSQFIHFKDFFANLKFKKFTRLSLSQSSFNFIDYYQLKPMLEYFSQVSVKQIGLQFGMTCFQYYDVIDLLNRISISGEEINLSIDIETKSVPSQEYLDQRQLKLQCDSKTQKLRFIPNFRNLRITNFITRSLIYIFPYLQSLEYSPCNQFDELWSDITKFKQLVRLKELNLDYVNLQDCYECFREIIEDTHHNLTSLRVNNTTLKLTHLIEIVTLLSQARSIKELSIIQTNQQRFNELSALICNQEAIQIQLDLFKALGKLHNLQLLEINIEVPESNMFNNLALHTLNNLNFLQSFHIQIVIQPRQKFDIEKFLESLQRKLPSLQEMTLPASMKIISIMKALAKRGRSIKVNQQCAIEYLQYKKLASSTPQHFLNVGVKVQSIDDVMESLP